MDDGIEIVGMRTFSESVPSRAQDRVYFLELVRREIPIRRFTLWSVARFCRPGDHRADLRLREQPCLASSFTTAMILSQADKRTTL
jgi:hypothetical protein